MYKLKYYDYEWREIKIPQEKDKIYKSKNHAWWTHFHEPPVTSYYTVNVIEVK